MTTPTRTTHRTVTFARPFVLSGLDGAQPAGRYTVETDEELLQALSFPAHRRLETRIRLRGGAGFEQVARVDPADLDDALVRDAAGKPDTAAAVGDRAPTPAPSTIAPTSTASAGQTRREPVRAGIARTSIAALRGILGRVRLRLGKGPAMTTNLFTISLTVLGIFLLLGGIAKFITP